MMSGNVRVRFAPSPTGNLHIGNVRTAIMNWLFARNTGGSFILRIEDTDEERSTRESEDSILGQLNWFGLEWDEGPVKGGDFGPYRQSERIDLYRSRVQKLLDSGKAYKCFCTKEDLEKDREKALLEKRDPGYSGRCRNLSEDEINTFESEMRKYVVRFRVPEGKVNFTDLVQGEMEFDAETITDFVIQREDGSSPYNFACVVDDAEMQISHVIRGNDHLSNTPRQVMLYETFGIEIPLFAHIPMILGQDGSRLSKRHGHTSLSEFRQEGYLPEALLNFLSLLSWSSESGDEVLSKDRLIEEFTFSRVSKSAAKFDKVKLNWMNGLYIRELDPGRRSELAWPYFEEKGLTAVDSETFSKIIDSVHDKVETLSEFPSKAEIYFQDEVEITGEEERSVIAGENTYTILKKLKDGLNAEDGFSVQSLMAVMKSIQKETGIKGKDLWMPVRVALTGQVHGPELQVVLDVIGRERCIRRLDAVLNS